MNRSGIEQRGDVLRQIKNGVDTPTRISYSVNCNYGHVCFVLNEFVDLGLVECSVPIVLDGMRKTRRYRITPRGEEFLSHVDDVRHLVGIEIGSISLLSEE